jgi:hypothetical protein
MNLMRRLDVYGIIVPTVSGEGSTANARANKEAA